MFACLEEVEKSRRMAALAAHAATVGTYFVARKRGGVSQQLKTGELNHGIQGACSNDYSTGWAKGRGLHVTFKATFSEYGPELSAKLVRAWCHRMQYFYDLELASTDADFAFTQDIIDGYVEPSELTELAAAAPDLKTMARIRQIRRIPQA